MKTKALKAWLASLPLALLAPMIIWAVIFEFLEKWDLQFGDLPALLAIFSLAGAIHFIAYALTGLVIFLFCFKKPHLKIWTFLGAVLTGTGAGALVFVIFDFATLSYVGAAYGLITAIAAYRQRPYRHENAHHLP